MEPKKQASQIMEEKKRNRDMERNERDIVRTQAVKAGKRIYYLDVKMNRKEELFLAITESKKVTTGEGDDAQINFEKHKIFLYREDLQKFMKALQQAVDFIDKHQPLDEESLTEETVQNEANDEIKIDIDF